MNKVFLLRRLTRDVDVKFSTSTPFARVGIAVDRRFSKEKITDFFNLVAFGKTAYFADGANKKAADPNDPYGGTPIDDNDTPF